MKLKSLLVWGMTAVALTGCGSGPQNGSGTQASGAAPAAKVLNYIIGNDVANMDPSLITDIESAIVAQQVYQGLTRFKADSVEVEPALAEKYECSPDGLKWTFTLRDGVKFSDGTPFNADAVKFSILRQMDPNHPFHVAGKMRSARTLFGDPRSTETMLVKDITSPDDRTVVFELARPYVPFLKNLAMVPASIVSPEAVRTMGQDFNTTMVGTGPFVVKSRQQDSSLVLARNPNYWSTAGPPLDEIRFRILRDANTRLNSIRKGESDVVSGIEPTSLELLKKESAIDLRMEPSLNLGYLSMNCAKPPFDNKLVRLAMNYAIDRDYIVNTLFSGTSVVAKGVIPPGMLGFDPERKGFAYDPAKAKQLLAEAGYPNGFSVTFSTHDVRRVYFPVGIRIAERIQQDLAKVGITAKIDQMEFSTFLSKVKARDYVMGNSGWVTDNGDPDNFLFELVGREDNEFNYSNPEATKLMRDATGEKDDAKRAALYRKAEDLVAADPPIVVLNNAKQILAVRKRVRNLKLHPTAVTQLDQVDVAGK
ncbi:MAG: ABC transporter substrate-binding protein [Candidatus Sumerlaeaceae bacterium]|nr:ABC transporter substrate-binding protein [Candidatus Sumerlaeaceae bacterium]